MTTVTCRRTPLTHQTAVNPGYYPSRHLQEFEIWKQGNNSEFLPVIIICFSALFTRKLRETTEWAYYCMSTKRTN